MAPTIRQRVVRVALGVAATVMLVLLIDRDAPPPGPPPVIAATFISGTGPVEIAGRSLDPGDEIHTGAIIRSATGGAATLRMADGVELRVDANTQLAFPGSGIVLVTRGGAFFDTAGRMGAMPIEVRTPIGTARDIGTRFEVRMVDGAMRVRVRDGIVQVDSNGESARVERGSELTATAAGSMTIRLLDVATVPIAP